MVVDLVAGLLNQPDAGWWGGGREGGDRVWSSAISWRVATAYTWAASQHAASIAWQPRPITRCTQYAILPAPSNLSIHASGCNKSPNK